MLKAKRLNANSSEVAVVLGERLARYGFGDGHPFGPDRHAAFQREFEQRGLAQHVLVLEPRDASTADLQLFHTPDYVRFVCERSQCGSGWLDGGDTPAFRGVFEAAACVVGSSLAAADWIMQRSLRRAFVPIGGLHHAARDRAAGFCVFNDCGVVVEHLRRAHGISRVAYVDIDAHHGDGVYYGFENDPELIFADLHESGHTLYPGTGDDSETGRGAAAGTKLNVPLPAGAGDVEFDAVWPRMLAHVERFAPEFFILQCGADSVAGDPITHLKLSSGCHARAARELCALADRLGHGRVLALGGGGYDRANLARTWSGVVEALLGAGLTQPPTQPSRPSTQPSN
jgi:acetoin utilization protein AcuC